MDLLTSQHNPAFQRLHRLVKDASARREQGRAVAEGPHLTEEAVASGLARQVWATEAAWADPAFRGLADRVRRQGLGPKFLAEGLLAKLSDTRTPQGWLCEVEPAAAPVPTAATVWLALDGLQDPGNVGTLLRCAWAAGAAVLVGKGCADPWSPKVLRAGSGAQFHAAMRETQDLPQELLSLARLGVDLYATAPNAADSYLDADCVRPCCWVLGSEGSGLSPGVADVCGRSYRIPYPGTAESLNAAVSGAVLLFEVLRQRRTKNAVK